MLSFYPICHSIPMGCHCWPTFQFHQLYPHDMRKTEGERKKHFTGTRERHRVFSLLQHKLLLLVWYDDDSGGGRVYCHFGGETGEKKRQLHTQICIHINIYIFEFCVYQKIYQQENRISASSFSTHLFLSLSSAVAFHFHFDSFCMLEKALRLSPFSLLLLLPFFFSPLLFLKVHDTCECQVFSPDASRVSCLCLFCLLLLLLTSSNKIILLPAVCLLFSLSQLFLSTQNYSARIYILSIE